MRRGFTLLEVVVTTFILATLAGIATPALMTGWVKAQGDKRATVIATVASAKEMARLEMSAEAISGFNSADNDTRLSALTSRGLVVIGNTRVTSMEELCNGTGKTEVMVGSFDIPPYFE